MAFFGQKFLNASILDFNCSLGRGSTPSQLSVRLVEDFASGDRFQPPSVGSAVNFSYESDNNGSTTNWVFAGLLQSYEKVSDISGNPIYEVFVTDPRELLSQTQVILSGYNGSVEGVHNLLNPYGYIENTQGFGEANVNDSGIPWKQLITAINDILGGANSTYGGPIKYRGLIYTVNTIGQLPDFPEDYRIGGDSIDLLSLTIQLCELGSLDYFFTLVDNIITLNTVSKLEEVQSGSIINFVNNTEGAKSKRLGIQSRHDITGKFVVGGDVIRQYLQVQADVQPDEEYETIIPFWGHDLDGNLIIGEGTGDDHTFTLDSRYIDIPGVGDTYTTNVAEMRAILQGQESWETFLYMNNGNFFEISNPVSNANPGLFDELDPGLDYYREPILSGKFEGGVRRVTSQAWKEHEAAGGNIDNLPINKTYFKLYHYDAENPKRNIFYMRAARLGLIGSFRNDAAYRWVDPDISLEEFLEINPIEFSPFKGSQIKIASNNRDRHEEHIKILYDFLAEYAHQYYGKRYMVTIPFVFAKIDDLDQIKTSLEPTDAGFLDESEWNDALALNLIPIEIDILLQQDGRILPYVRFDQIDTIDFSKLAEEDYALNIFTDSASIFIKCSLHSQIVFQDKETAFSPRVVIELPTQILTSNEEDRDDYAGLIVDFLNSYIPSKAEQRRLEEPEKYDRYVTATNAQDNINEDIQKLLEKPGGNLFNEPYAGLYVIPRIAAVPLKSNIQVYGPYFNIGIEGRVEFEKDESLVPWNYGSYDLMNLAGDIKVRDVSSQGFNESGAVEVPGTPTIQLGNRLVALGPLVTDIRVNIGPQGILTTYIMNNFGPRIGSDRNSLDRLREQGKLTQQMRRKFRQLLRKPPPPGSKYYDKRKHMYLKRKDSKSSHSVFAGTMSGENVSVFTTPSYHAIAEIENNYYNNSVVSLDTIFSPVSVYPEYSGSLPRFEEPTESGGINSLSLNPFPATTGNYLTNSIITVGETLPEEGLFHRDNLHQDGDFRVMAFRGPLILHSWGFDTDGQPVPAESGVSDHFASGYLSQPSTWPVGPVDVRWDNKRKVWTNITTLSIVKPTVDVQPRTAELCDFYTGPRNALTIQLDEIGSGVMAYCFNADDDLVIDIDTECIAVPFTNLGISSYLDSNNLVTHELIPLQCSP